MKLEGRHFDRFCRENRILPICRRTYRGIGICLGEGDRIATLEMPEKHFQVLWGLEKDGRMYFGRDILIPARVPHSRRLDVAMEDARAHIDELHQRAAFTAQGVKT